MVVTATTPDGTQVLRRAPVVIKKAKPKKKSKRPADKRVQPRAVAAPVSAPDPPAPTPPADNTTDGLEPSPRESGATNEQPRFQTTPLATATKFVGEKQRRTVGLGLVIMSMGAAIGFLIKIELGRLLRWPKRLVA